jgi:hypothetical protein
LKNKTIDSVSKQAGFDNRETCRQAKKVVANGSPQFIEAMARDQVAISTAARIAKLPIAVQKRAFGAECS